MGKGKATLFYHYPELKRAWVLKESFRAWYRETDRSMAFKQTLVGLLTEKLLIKLHFSIK